MAREASEESVLSRWSRRKVEARDGNLSDELDLPAVEETPAAIEQPAVQVEQPEPPALTDADMPDLDSLTSESDFSLFMSKGVSDKLRNMALRKMFAAPVFNIRDGLDEYDEDFTTFEKLGDIVTCDMKHQIEMQEKKRLEKLQQEQQEAELSASEEVEPEEAETVAADDEVDSTDDIDQPSFHESNDSDTDTEDAEQNPQSITNRKSANTDE